MEGAEVVSQPNRASDTAWEVHATHASGKLFEKVQASSETLVLCVSAFSNPDQGLFPSRQGFNPPLKPGVMGVRV